MKNIVIAYLFCSFSIAKAICLINKDLSDCTTYKTMKECRIVAVKTNGICAPEQSIFGANYNYCRIIDESTGEKQCLYKTLEDCTVEAKNFDSSCVKNN